jgi:hypothetical protein
MRIFGVVKIFVSWEVEGGSVEKTKVFVARWGRREVFVDVKAFIVKGRVSCG